MDYSLHRYRSACGRLDLVARDYPARDYTRTGPAPVLLLMHGLTRNSADFEPLAAHLSDTYRLIVPDQRGRGLSQWDPEPANYRPDVYAQDMFALLDGLEIERACLVGTSMGGLMAMVMNAVRPGLATGFVFNDIGPVLDPAGLARIQGYVGPSEPMASWTAAAARCRAVNAVAFPDYGKAEWLAFARRTCRENADGTVSLDYDPAIAQSMAGDAPQTVPVDLWPLWDALDAAPVLVVRGELSDLLSRETVREMAQRHSGPYSHVEVPRVGHAPILDEVSALAAILSFCKEYLD
ncbi:pimeloyl-ACP methyl ester carboxylesterase [Novosphingobium sp. PhB165]|uniref:alpha/beta fold hydrolase n=1 Tax=Novosphingobium sp. PhB165 TaxID=2485105 RepID=UPI001047DC42|nr:alpha/beta hydrolase [Novosphingobium sp. PhB165]TCM19792.1 pimeloyl-ACP methyl ester carboxylesterase [Novosphingobium sp. PhB165]